jgi:hypothetical protein
MMDWIFQANHLMDDEVAQKSEDWWNTSHHACEKISRCGHATTAYAPPERRHSAAYVPALEILVRGHDNCYHGGSAADERR